ncbi:hypothetical protein HMPREF1553_01609 [Porphyromonas gingivalis F0568]|nr:hypothetical protein HMPREF1553_01609 [Porphyromonas gingivalis F0568]
MITGLYALEIVSIKVRPIYFRTEEGLYPNLAHSRRTPPKGLL